MPLVRLFYSKTGSVRIT